MLGKSSSIHISVSATRTNNDGPEDDLKGDMAMSSGNPE
jgi:hypothetical protein